ncbi:MAG: pantothenate kinase [Bacteroidetes bacterium]|nr:MAG: pantothenate kinase [Bacteroidota bacterium]
MLASIDIGNTQVKIGLFKEDILHEVENIAPKAILNFLREHDVSNVIISSVNKTASLVLELKNSYADLIVLSSETEVPIGIDYETPNSLGIDRVAAAVGAIKRVNGPVAIVDAGTCITCDIIDEKNVFQGGTISPGLEMRLQAMHTFTAKLPLLKLKTPKELVGKSTEAAMLSGVVNGSRLEIEGILGKYNKKYPKLTVIICGGNAKYFDKMKEFNIFVVPNLVLEGLNAILRFNGKI